MSMKTEACAYWERGWAPIPLRMDGDESDRKRPAISAWRQYQFDLPKRREVESWWNASPEANIAILTGRVSGLVVLDFDGEVEDPVEFLTGNGLPSDCPIVQTGGGGFHCYFAHPGGEVKNGVRIGRIDDVGIDVRGDGGYVVAPPSIHGSGRAYGWLQEGPLVPLPDAYRRMLSKSPDAKPATNPNDLLRQASDVDLILEGTPEGGRNDAATRVAGYFLRACKGDEVAALKDVQLWNRQNTPPLPERELLHVFTSIAERDRQARTVDPAKGPLMVLRGKSLYEAVRFAPPRRGIQTPSLPSLEEVGGIVPKDLLILAGRPGMGKSTAAWGVASDIGIDAKQPTLIFSTEMTTADVVRWTASKMYQTPVRDLTEEQWEQAVRAVARSPLSICDQGAVSVDQIIETIEARPETKLVIIDHIQRLQWDGDSRNQAIEKGAARLKSVAKDNDCTILLLSQMNRAGGQAGQPQLYHLRDSGGLEQEADAVIFLWSDVEDLTLNPLPVKFYLAKNRHGALTEVSCEFHKHLKLFRRINNFVEQVAAEQQAVRHHERMQQLLDMEDPFA